MPVEMVNCVLRKYVPELDEEETKLLEPQSMIPKMLKNCESILLAWYAQKITEHITQYIASQS